MTPDDPNDPNDPTNDPNEPINDPNDPGLLLGSLASRRGRRQAGDERLNLVSHSGELVTLLADTEVGDI